MNQPSPSTVTLVCQKWQESEAGWGIRPDGFSVHRSSKDCEQYIRQYWDGMPSAPPPEYSRPAGAAYVFTVSQEQARAWFAFFNCDHDTAGIRFWHNNYPTDNSSPE